MPDAHPTVTVLMPVRNVAPFVGNALTSVLQQTFADFELLVVDDGSTDQTPNRVHRTARRDSRVRLLSPGRVGLVAALNRGLTQARGELIARMDGDDVCFPDRLARQVAFLAERPRVAVVGAGLLVIGPDSRPICEPRPACEHAAIVDALFAGGLGVGLSHPAVMMRRSAVESVGGYRAEFDTAEDLDLWLRLAEHHTLANLPHTLLKYRLHPNSVESTRLVRQYQVRQQVLETAAQRLGRTDLDPTAGPRLPDRNLTEAESYRWWARLAEQGGFWDTARRYRGRAERLFAWQLFRAHPLSRTNIRRLVKSLGRPRSP